ncbi:hypothetical protein [Halobaculum limi]|uniref:hypothetical protein n=1 Tax=Halobaculum limi TaxID=3031916 RepID=UPI002406C0EA|nr:hypothetical protein [Halobaculum sp. YSMS11]
MDPDWPAVDGGGTHELAVETLAGTLRTAVSIRAWHGTDAPTLVWHHGGGEYPYDTIFSGTFPDPDTVGANLVVIRAPGHESRLGVQRVGATLSRYLATLAVAVAATEHILDEVDGRTIVSGYSLGGFVTNRHHVHHDTADVYVPLMAGTAHGEIFLSSVPAAPAARDRPEYLRRRLNFTDSWGNRDHDHVHPVLGRHDRLNHLGTQRSSYPGVSPAVWPVGHLSGIGAHERIRQTLEPHLRR